MSSWHLQLFGSIPFGTHPIRIVRFDSEKISSQKDSKHVPVWNHAILLVPIHENRTEYTDRVEIRVGWKTIFIWLWAKAFYAHRQRKWIMLFRKGEALSHSDSLVKSTTHAMLFWQMINSEVCRHSGSLSNMSTGNATVPIDRAMAH